MLQNAQIPLGLRSGEFSFFTPRNQKQHEEAGPAQTVSVGLLPSPAFRPGAVNLHNLHIEIIRITILIIIWPFKLLNSLWTLPPPGCQRCSNMGFSQVRIWELVYLVQVTIMINDPQIFAMKITRSFTSDTFKTGDLLDYLIFSDMRGRG